MLIDCIVGFNKLHFKLYILIYIVIYYCMTLN